MISQRRTTLPPLVAARVQQDALELSKDEAINVVSQVVHLIPAATSFLAGLCARKPTVIYVQEGQRVMRVRVEHI